MKWHVDGTRQRARGAQCDYQIDPSANPRRVELTALIGGFWSSLGFFDSAMDARRWAEMYDTATPTKQREMVGGMAWT